LADKYNEFDDFRKGKKSEGLNIIDINTDTNKKVDSIIKNANFQESLKGLDSSERAEALGIINQVKDSVKSKKILAILNLTTTTVS
jgi:hypothetical protein